MACPSISGVLSDSPICRLLLLLLLCQSDAMDAIFFLRVLQAIVFGVSFGFLGLEGLYPFLTYLATSLVIPSMWFRYQGIDDEHFGSGTADADDETIAAPQPIGMEAIGPGLSMFMVRLLK